MRIDNNTRAARVTAGGPRGRAGGASGFAVATGGSAATGSAAGLAPTAPTTGIEGLLALQAVDDPLTRRRRMVRRGNDLLDSLEALKADLLVGRITEERLARLAALLGEARERSLPGLDGLLDDIELRVEVELAKRGKFCR